MLAVGFALLLRFDVPAGWMPMHDSQGLRLVLCDGHGPVTLSAEPPVRDGHHGDHGADAMAMGLGDMPAAMDHSAKSPHVMHGDGAGQAPEDHGHGGDDPLCAFAAANAPVTSVDPIDLPPAPAILADEVQAVFHAFPGRGLAAPPPPATGPPANS